MSILMSSLVALTQPTFGAKLAVLGQEDDPPPLAGPDQVTLLHALQGLAEGASAPATVCGPAHDQQAVARRRDRQRADRVGSEGEDLLEHVDEPPAGPGLEVIDADWSGWELSSPRGSQETTNVEAGRRLLMSTSVSKNAPAAPKRSPPPG